MEDTQAVPNNRVATHADLPQVAQLWLEMFEAVGNHQEADFAADWRARFVDYCAKRMRTNDLRFFVLEEGGKVVACAGALVREGYPTEIHGIRSGYIFGVSVRPQMRGRGIGTTLTQRCVEWFSSMGIARIRLHASPFGRPIYEKLGFVATNEMELR